MKQICLLCALVVITSITCTSFAQSTTKGTITPYQSIYQSALGTVSIQYLLYPCSNKDSNRMYGFTSTITQPGAWLTGYFDYEMCDGKIESESFAVYLDKPGKVHSDGAWILNTNHIIRVHSVVLHDPQGDERKRQSAALQKQAEDDRQADLQRQQEQQRQIEQHQQAERSQQAAENKARQEQAANQQRQQENQQQANLRQEQKEQREAEQQQRAEQNREADESDRRLAEATEKTTDPAMKAMYEQNRQNAQNIQDPTERKRFLDQQAQSVQQSNQVETVVNAATPLVTDMLTSTHSKLRETDDILALEGGIANFLDPALTSNTTQSFDSNPLGYYVKFSALSRTGLSFSMSLYYLNMQNEKFNLYLPNTKGQLTSFTGTLKAETAMLDVSLGKTFMTKSGRLALYLGPFAAYATKFDHSFTYNGSQTYTEKAIDSGQFLFGGQANLYIFITNGIALTSGMRYNAFFSKPTENQAYSTANFKSFSVGLCIRLD